MKNKYISWYTGFLFFFFLTCFFYSFQYKCMNFVVEHDWIQTSPSKSQIQQIETIMDTSVKEFVPLEKMTERIKGVVHNDYLIQILITKDSPYSIYTDEYLTTVNGRVPNLIYRSDEIVTFIQDDDYRVELYPSLFSFFTYFGAACIALSAAITVLLWYYRIPGKLFNFIKSKLRFFKKYLPASMSRQLGGVLFAAAVCFFGIYFCFQQCYFSFVDLVTQPLDIPPLVEEHFKKEKVADKLSKMNLEDDDVKKIRKVLKDASMNGLSSSVYDEHGDYIGGVNLIQENISSALMPHLQHANYQAPVYFSKFYKLQDTKILVAYVFLPYSFLASFYSVFALALSSISMYFIVKFYVQKQIERIQKLQQHIDAFSLGDWSYPIAQDSKDEIGQLFKDLEQLRLCYVEKSEQEESALQANRQLITDLSHDLRTPLTILKGYLEILQLNLAKDAEQKEKYLRMAQEKANLIEQLSNKTLEYAMISQPKLSAHIKTVVSDTILQQVSDQIEYLIMKDYTVTFDYEIAKDSVQIDESYWHRILNNLFSNVLKYADKKAEVKVYLRISGCIFLEITNKKIPIKEQERNKIGLKSVEKMLRAQNGSLEIIQNDAHFTVQITLGE